MNIKRKINDAIWWVKHRTTHRYHIIDISGQDGYDRGWIDRDHAMYLACFKILCDFVELEDPDIGNRTLANYTSENYKPEGDELAALEAQIADEKEIRYLYDWWTTGRRYLHEKARKQLDAAGPGIEKYKTPEFEAWCKEMDRLDAMDEEMLARLMKVRRRLWT